ncbi:unnamed protein product [Darwinula stevensoni]|uniref:Major facilitator superfamily (MFS) profile domain-containing protein n=1 Tax=Darwinula stevensoni TaxID=69355 RepID=A0A7R8WY23_9CRUS|nr:unnamed protein product [Darwinula stevensoni]CAG0878580.1 unnamed protein product [Darwinula stevensoni]
MIPTYDSCRMYNLTEEELTSWPPQAMDFTNRSQISCSSWEYNRTIFTNTIINQYGIVCDNKYLSQVAQSTYMFGVLIGCVLSGHLADRVGRKPVMLWSVILMLVVGVATSFAPEVISFVILRFITAMAAAALYTTAFVVDMVFIQLLSTVMEAVGGHHRPIIGLAYQYPFSIGFMSLAGISWFARDWKHLELAISVPVSVFLLYYWFLPESPRWLYSKKRDAEAKAILDKARKKNKLPPKESSASITPTVHDVDQEDAMKEQHYTILHLFKGPRLRYRTINLFWNWFVNSFVYYGLALNSGNLGGDIFINVFIGGVYTNEWPVVTLAMIGKFGISASFAIIYVFSAEIYPTVVRNIGVGSSSMCARIGSIIAPWVAQLEKDLSLQKEHVFIFKGEYTHEFVPIVVFGASSLIAGLLALFLPETKGQRIPETLEDAERVAKKFVLSFNFVTTQ